MIRRRRTEATRSRTLEVYAAMQAPRSPRAPHRGARGDDGDPSPADALPRRTRCRPTGAVHADELTPGADAPSPSAAAGRERPRCGARPPFDFWAPGDTATRIATRSDAVK